jgi:hypothetical protein
MNPDATVRIANSMQQLDRLLDEIEAGRKPAPDWVRIQGGCRLEAMSDDALDALLARLHRNLLRGFRIRPLEAIDPQQRLATWRRIARAGFHDFGTQGFSKCYGSPFVEDYDYVKGYVEGGLDGLDPYAVYTAILGTHDYTIEDFLQTPTCEKIDTVIEPMAGTGEFTHCSHFRHPELRYILFDLDESARETVLARPWLEGCKPCYRVGDVLDSEVWRDVHERSVGRSLAYIGKQSHNFFDTRDLYRLLELGTSHVDHFVLETPEPALVSELAAIDDLTRPEMLDAGFHAALVEDETRPPNPFTNDLGFRMEVWDDRDSRVLFEYPKWRAWQPPTLVALAELLDLEVLYLNEAAGDFVPVDACQIARPGAEHHMPRHIERHTEPDVEPDASSERRVDHSEAHDGVGFMLFRRRS